jgi:hypothetical protein
MSSAATKTLVPRGATEDTHIGGYGRGPWWRRKRWQSQMNTWSEIAGEKVPRILADLTAAITVGTRGALGIWERRK